MNICGTYETTKKEKGGHNDETINTQYDTKNGQMSNKFDSKIINRFDLYLQKSIKYALDHKDDALEYAMQYSRGKSRELIEKFVLMYVNDVTVDMGESGEKSIRTLFDMAKQKNLVPDFELKISELIK